MRRSYDISLGIERFELLALVKFWLEVANKERKCIACMHFPDAMYDRALPIGINCM